MLIEILKLSSPSLNDDRTLIEPRLNGENIVKAYFYDTVSFNGHSVLRKTAYTAKFNLISDSIHIFKFADVVLINFNLRKNTTAEITKLVLIFFFLAGNKIPSFLLILIFLLRILLLIHVIYNLIYFFNSVKFVHRRLF